MKFLKKLLLYCLNFKLVATTDLARRQPGHAIALDASGGEGDRSGGGAARLLLLLLVQPPLLRGHHLQPDGAGDPDRRHSLPRLVLTLCDIALHNCGEVGALLGQRLSSLLPLLNHFLKVRSDVSKFAVSQ